MGDVTVLGELGVELWACLAAEVLADGLVEGVCEVVVTNPDLVIDTAEAAVDVRDGVEEVNDCAKKRKGA